MFTWCVHCFRNGFPGKPTDIFSTVPGDRPTDGASSRSTNDMVAVVEVYVYFLLKNGEVLQFHSEKTGEVFGKLKVWFL